MSRPWSIQTRVSRRLIAMVILAWLASVGLAVVFLDHEINEMMDEELQALAQSTVLILDATPGRVIPRSIGVDPGNGERVLRILNLPETLSETPSETLPAVPWPALQEDGFHSLQDWRVLRVTAENAVIEVGHNTAWRREEMLEAASAFLVLMLPMVLLLLWGGRASLRQGFAPLSRLAASVAARDATDLSPVATADLPDEVKPLATGLNLYVSRIEALRQAERQFIANASHELRTPVAAIRARLELSADLEARAALPQLDALTRRVERLLQLSRSEAGLGAETGPADLVEITRLLIREIGSRAADALQFDDGDLEHVLVAADPDALAILLRNLLENAAEHGSGPVRIRLTTGNEVAGVAQDAAPDPTEVSGASQSPVVQLAICNPVQGGAFETTPFRKRPGSGGAGLGLTIVAQLAQAMGARLNFEMTATEARVTIQLPRASPLA